MLGPSSEGGEMIHDPTHPKTREEQDDEFAQLAHRRMSLAAVAIIYFLLVAWADYLMLPD